MGSRTYWQKFRETFNNPQHYGKQISVQISSACHLEISELAESILKQEDRSTERTDREGT
jgi:hypothetical protein